MEALDKSLEALVDSLKPSEEENKRQDEAFAQVCSMPYQTHISVLTCSWSAHVASFLSYISGPKCEHKRTLKTLQFDLYQPVGSLGVALKVLFLKWPTCRCQKL